MLFDNAEPVSPDEQEIRLDDVVGMKTDIQRGEEHFAKIVAFDRVADEPANAVQDTLMFGCRRRGRDELSSNDLVAVAVVGRAEQIFVGGRRAIDLAPSPVRL